MLVLSRPTPPLTQISNPNRRSRPIHRPRLSRLISPTPTFSPCCRQQAATHVQLAMHFPTTRSRRTLCPDQSARCIPLDLTRLRGLAESRSWSYCACSLRLNRTRVERRRGSEWAAGLRATPSPSLVDSTTRIVSGRRDAWRRMAVAG